MTNAGEVTVFWICGILAVLGALGLVTSRKAVHSALWVALTMINLAVLYIANQAPFLGMAQVIVYTGAVMMLFLFVLMVVGVDASDSFAETIKGQRVAGVLFAIAMAVILIAAIGTSLSTAIEGSLQVANDQYGGNVQGIANLIFTKYLVAFEVTSALLITAALGAMVLAHREQWMPRKSQPELSRERFLGTEHPGNRPNPGVYARHNAVDTPALLPDGSTSVLSVPRPLQARDAVNEPPAEDIAEAKALAAGDTYVSEEGGSQ